MVEKSKGRPQRWALDSLGGQMTIEKPNPPEKHLISIDPGKDRFAWAAFENDKLVRCDLFTAWSAGIERMSSLKGDVLVFIELPQVYNQRHWKGDPNDLIGVALTVGGLKFAARTAREVRLVLPHEWKGNVPKAVMLKRIESKLDDDEKEVLAQAAIAKGHRHDVVDAIGIGLWALGRLG
jgi:hypothetical protein